MQNKFREERNQCGINKNSFKNNLRFSDPKVCIQCENSITAVSLSAVSVTCSHFQPPNTTFPHPSTSSTPEIQS